ncbi:MAG: sensor histidine kinase, partial [Bacteroidota bacterium]
VLYELGLKEAILWLAGKTAEEYNLKIETKLDIGDISLSDDILILIFRTVREILFNTVKHADASLALIEMRKTEGRLFTRISDNGCGFDVGSAGKQVMKKGFGLFAVKERIKNLSGDLSINSEQGKGTVVEFYLPLD